MCGETVRGKYYVHNGQPICEVDYKVCSVYIDHGIRFQKSNVLELFYLEENLQQNNVIFKILRNEVSQFFVLNLTTEDIIRLCLEMHFLVTYKCDIIYQGAVIYRQIL